MCALAFQHSQTFYNETTQSIITYRSIVNLSESDAWMHWATLQVKQRIMNTKLVLVSDRIDVKMWRGVRILGSIKAEIFEQNMNLSHVKKNWLKLHGELHFKQWLNMTHTKVTHVTSKCWPILVQKNESRWHRWDKHTGAKLKWMTACCDSVWGLSTCCCVVWREMSSHAR